jgi:glycosyltransferase involved in cell wall biosynthesis
MKILIDFTQIPVQRAGAGVYAENLVRELPAFLRPEDSLYLLLQRDELKAPLLIEGMKNVRCLFIPSRLFRNRLMLMFFEQLILPWLLLHHAIDVVHSLHYTLPLWSPSARVVTFHDLTMLLWPEMHTRGRRIIMPIYIRLAWHLADEIIFVSEATRSDAGRLLSPTKGRLRAVVPLGISSEAFGSVSQEDSRLRLGLLQVKKPYLLFIGTIEPRKNLVRVIHAFEKIAGQFPDHILVLAGKLGWDFDPVLEAIARSSYCERIQHIGYVSEPDKQVLLAGCSVLVYASLYEGFGLPVLEAMAAGVPVVTSNVSSLPEVAGEAALMVDPESVDQMSAAMARLLGDPELRRTLSTLGIERARMFSWKKMAGKSFEAYLNAYKVGKHGRNLQAG